MRISATTTATVTHTVTITVASHPGAPHATVGAARIRKTPVHRYSSGRESRNTLQKRKKWVTGSPTTRLHDESITASAAVARAPIAKTPTSTADNRKPGEKAWGECCDSHPLLHGSSWIPLNRSRPLNYPLR